MRRRLLQWYGHVHRRNRDEDIIMVAEMKIQRKRGRPKKRLMDTVKDVILKCGLSDDSTWCPAKPLPILDHSILRR